MGLWNVEINTITVEHAYAANDVDGVIYSTYEQYHTHLMDSTCTRLLRSAQLLRVILWYFLLLLNQSCGARPDSEL